MPKLRDLSGKRFGKLLVEKRVENGSGGNSRWLCLCDCGNRKEVLATSLLSGKVRSCGCYRKECSVINMVGKKFGKLTVVSKTDDRSSSGSVKWLCACECGNKTVVDGTALRNGSTKSCGCGISEAARKNGSAHKTHGKSRSRLYFIWSGMKRRCYNEKDSQYHNYGGRGIRVCDEWNNSFSFFMSWAISNGYDEKAPARSVTLDRIDVNGNYCPENCRFVSMKVQNRNRRNNKMITSCGITMCKAEWEEMLGISRSTMDRWCSKNIESAKIASILKV